MASNRALSSPSNTLAFLWPLSWITPPASILFPTGQIKVKKNLYRKTASLGNKSPPGRVYPHEHVHTRRGLVPLSLQARAILPREGRNVRGMAVTQEQRF
jgi:hypothetical protein